MRTDILVVGDSWASAVVSGEGNPNDNGWPLLLDVPREMRQAVAGSTAVQWSCNFNDRLTAAINTPAETVIISLLGNDARAAMEDGNVTFREVGSSLNHMHRVITALKRKRTILLLYCDPYFGLDPRSRIVVPLINTAIRLSAYADAEYFDMNRYLDRRHFNGVDFHPNRAGHEIIAREFGSIL